MNQSAMNQSPMNQSPMNQSAMKPSPFFVPQNTQHQKSPTMKPIGIAPQQILPINHLNAFTFTQQTFPPNDTKKKVAKKEEKKKIDVTDLTNSQ
jgi:hypothetical protein